MLYHGEAPENATPLTYRVPATADIPEFFESFIAEQRLARGPGGLKGIGEAGMLGIAAAIGNAIQDATGASGSAVHAGEGLGRAGCAVHQRQC